MSESEKKSYEQLEAELKETRKRLNSEFTAQPNGNASTFWPWGLCCLLMIVNRQAETTSEMRSNRLSRNETGF